MVMRSPFILAALLSLSAAALGQVGGSVSGRVTETRIVGLPRPVSGVKVRIDRADGSETSEAATGAKGEYSFAGLAPGKYRVTAFCDFCPEGGVGRQIEVESAEGVTADVELLPTVGRQTVTISADRVQSVEEVSKSVDVIDGQEMRDRADFSLTDALRTIPGLRVQQYGGFGKTTVIKTRGLRNQDTALLLDGVRVRDVSSITGDASAFLSDFTLTSVSRVEVLRGSGSSLYGTNSIGGTIDFQTPRAQQGWHGQAGGALGGLGFGRFRGNLSNGTKDGRFGFTSGVSRTVYTKGVDGQDDASNTNLQGRIDASPASTMTVSVRMFYSDASVRLNSNPDTVGPLPSVGTIRAVRGSSFVPDANDPDAIQRSRLFNGQVSMVKVLSADLVFSANYSFLRTRRRNDDGLLGVGYQSESTSIFKGTVHTAGARLDWTPNQVHQFRAGYEFENENFENDGSTPSGSENFSTRASQTGNSLYAQDLVSMFGGRLMVSGSLRVQGFRTAKPSFSLRSAPYTSTTYSNAPRAVTFDGSATYNVRRTGTSLKAHLGNGYRVPSLYERFGTYFSTYPAPVFIALGDPDLKPERTLAADAGIEQKLTGGKAKLSATYFYTKLLDTIGYGYNGRPVPGVSRPYGGYLNEKGGIARGAELSVDVAPSASTRVFAAYTFTNSDQRKAQIPSSGTVETLGIAKHQFSFVATQRFKGFWVNADFSAMSGYLAPIFSNTTYGTYAYRFDGMRRLDSTFGRTFGVGGDSRSVRVFVTVENILDDEYFENGFRTPGRAARLGMAFVF